MTSRVASVYLFGTTLSLFTLINIPSLNCLEHNEANAEVIQEQDIEDVMTDQVTQILSEDPLHPIFKTRYRRRLYRESDLDEEFLIKFDKLGNPIIPAGQCYDSEGLLPELPNTRVKNEILAAETPLQHTNIDIEPKKPPLVINVLVLAQPPCDHPPEPCNGSAKGNSSIVPLVYNFTANRDQLRNSFLIPTLPNEPSASQSIGRVLVPKPRQNSSGKTFTSQNELHPITTEDIVVLAEKSASINSVFASTSDRTFDTPVFLPNQETVIDRSVPSNKNAINNDIKSTYVMDANRDGFKAHSLKPLEHLDTISSGKRFPTSAVIKAGAQQPSSLPVIFNDFYSSTISSSRPELLQNTVTRSLDVVDGNGDLFVNNKWQTVVDDHSATPKQIQTMAGSTSKGSVPKEKTPKSSKSKRPVTHQQKTNFRTKISGKQTTSHNKAESTTVNQTTSFEVRSETSSNPTQQATDSNSVTTQQFTGSRPTTAAFSSFAILDVSLTTLSLENQDSTPSLWARGFFPKSRRRINQPSRTTVKFSGRSKHQTPFELQQGTNAVPTSFTVFTVTHPQGFTVPQQVITETTPGATVTEVPNTVTVTTSTSGSTSDKASPPVLTQRNPYVPPDLIRYIDPGWGEESAAILDKLQSTETRQPTTDQNTEVITVVQHPGTTEVPKRGLAGSHRPKKSKGKHSTPFEAAPLAEPTDKPAIFGSRGATATTSRTRELIDNGWSLGLVFVDKDIEVVKERLTTSAAPLKTGTFVPRGSGPRIIVGHKPPTLEPQTHTEGITKEVSTLDEFTSTFDTSAANKVTTVPRQTTDFITTEDHQFISSTSAVLIEIDNLTTRPIENSAVTSTTDFKNLTTKTSTDNITATTTSVDIKTKRLTTSSATTERPSTAKPIVTTVRVTRISNENATNIPHSLNNEDGLVEVQENGFPLSRAALPEQPSNARWRRFNQTLTTSAILSTTFIADATRSYARDAIEQDGFSTLGPSTVGYGPPITVPTLAPIATYNSASNISPSLPTIKQDLSSQAPPAVEAAKTSAAVQYSLSITEPSATQTVISSVVQEIPTTGPRPTVNVQYQPTTVQELSYTAPHSVPVPTTLVPIQQTLPSNIPYVPTVAQGLSTTALPSVATPPIATINTPSLTPAAQELSSLIPTFALPTSISPTGQIFALTPNIYISQTSTAIPNTVTQSTVTQFAAATTIKYPPALLETVQTQPPQIMPPSALPTQPYVQQKSVIPTPAPIPSSYANPPWIQSPPNLIPSVVLPVPAYGSPPVGNTIPSYRANLNYGPQQPLAYSQGPVQPVGPNIFNDGNRGYSLFPYLPRFPQLKQGAGYQVPLPQPPVPSWQQSIPQYVAPPSSGGYGRKK